MKNLLVTGGAGFIGSAFARAALAALPSASVVVLDALTYAGNRANLPEHERLDFVHGDVRDGAGALTLMRERRIDAVVHFAAETHVDRSITGPAVFLDTNIAGTTALLEAARVYWLDEGGPDSLDRPVRFHQVSTDEVYGDIPEHASPVDERARYRPGNPYAASKAAADHLVRAWGRTYGLPWSISHGGNTYGPRQFPEKLLPLMIANALSDRPLPVYGDGLQRRDWLFVDDHAAAVLAILGGPANRSWNVGAGGEHPNLAVIRQLCGVLDEAAPRPTPHADAITFVADRPGHDRRYAMDVAAIAAELGWRASTPLAEGLRRTVDWTLSHRGWLDRVRATPQYQDWLRRHYKG